MDDVLVGILAVVVGLLVAFVGYRALRTMIALLGVRFTPNRGGFLMPLLG